MSDEPRTVIAPTTLVSLTKADLEVLIEHTAYAENVGDDILYRRLRNARAALVRDQRGISRLFKTLSEAKVEAATLRAMGYNAYTKYVPISLQKADCAWRVVVSG